MINHVNENAYSHILTVEDPIEFVHQPKKCLINQREIGPHTLSFQNALRSALREDPDVILVGEMRDLENHPPGPDRRRDRPPGIRHPAHLERGQDDRPHRRCLPRGRKGNGSIDAFRIVARGDLANPAQNQGRSGTSRCLRDPDRDTGDSQPDP
jgi:hypothetical protein